LLIPRIRGRADHVRGIGPSLFAASLSGEQSQAKRIAYGHEGIPIAGGLTRNLNQFAAKLGIAGLG
jgi:hypothetical protein